MISYRATNYARQFDGPARTVPQETPPRWSDRNSWILPAYLYRSRTSFPGIIFDFIYKPPSSFDIITMTADILKGLVLVTGANGYIAGHVIDALLKSGYAVRGTVRSRPSGDGLCKALHQYANNLEIVEVPDITVDGAFDSAANGMERNHPPTSFRNIILTRKRNHLCHSHRSTRQHL